jgi:hypothetical protein
MLFYDPVVLAAMRKGDPEKLKAFISRADYRLRNLRDLKTVEWRFKANVKPALGKVQASRFGPSQVRAYVDQRRTAGASDTQSIVSYLLCGEGLH